MLPVFNSAILGSEQAKEGYKEKHQLKKALSQGFKGAS